MNVLKSTPAGIPRLASEDSPAPRTNRNSSGCTSWVTARRRSLRNRISSRRHTMLIARRSCRRPLAGTATRIASVTASWLAGWSVTSIAIGLPPPAERHDVGTVTVADRRFRVPYRVARVGHEHVVERRTGHAHAADLLRQLGEQARHELLPGCHVKRHQTLVHGRVEIEPVLELSAGRLVVGCGDLHPVLADA